MRILLPLYGLLLVVFAAGVLFVVKAGLDDYVASNSLAAMQVDPPDGWSARPYQSDDGAFITQVPGGSAAATGTTGEILASYDIPTGGLNEGGVTTFLQGEEMIAMRIHTAPHKPKRVSLMDRFGRQSRDDDEIDPDAVFATVAGLPLIEHPRVSHVDDALPVPVNYRYFTMTIGDQTVDEILEVSFLTNSSDAAMVAVLNGLDMVALNGRLPTPDPRVMASAGVLTRDALPLSDEPPLPTPAYRAMELLAAGQVFDAPWQDALVQIRNGEIASLDALQLRYPRIDTLPFQLLDVLNDGSDVNTARYYAAILSNSGRVWTGHEVHVLSTIAEAGTTQADLSEYIAGEFEVSPEVLALAQRLPLEPAVSATETQVVRSSVVPAAGLSGAASCVIENGVRRCVIGNN